MSSKAILSRILKEPYAKAKKALKQFPSIGDPGAEKILLYCGAGEGLPLDWNGSRVLLRHRLRPLPAEELWSTIPIDSGAVAGQLPRDAAGLACADLLLRQHGKAICRGKRRAASAR